MPSKLWDEVAHAEGAIEHIVVFEHPDSRPEIKGSTGENTFQEISSKSSKRCWVLWLTRSA